MNYTKRTQALVDKVRLDGLDWLIVSGLKNIRYLSGFTGSHAMLLIGPERRYIITDGRYDEQVRKEVQEYEPVIQGKRKDLDALRDTLGDASGERIGFEAEHCSCARFAELQEALRAGEWIAQKGLVEDLRICKDEDEIAAMRQALQIAEESLKVVIGEITAGITERKLARLLEDHMWKRGATDRSFETIVLFGAHSSLPHGKPSDHTLSRGDVVLMDFGCVVDGYCSDITRTFLFGSASEELKSMYECVYEANKNAERSLRAGMNCKEADEIARSVIRDAGRDKDFMHGLGHGVGLDIHEAPRLSYIADAILQSGNVVTVEPGVYVSGVGGIRIEDMVVVREHGCEVLNESPTELTVL